MFHSWSSTSSIHVHITFPAETHGGCVHEGMHQAMTRCRGAKTGGVSHTHMLLGLDPVNLSRTKRWSLMLSVSFAFTAQAQEAETGCIVLMPQICAHILHNLKACS